MFPNSKSGSDRARKPEIVRILIYLGITLAVNFITSLLYDQYATQLVISFSREFSLPALTVLRAFNILSKVPGCIVSAYLYRRYVFGSRKSVVPAIIILILFNAVGTLLLSAFSATLVNAGTAITQTGANIISLFSLCISAVIVILSYVLQRYRLYPEADDDSAYRSKLSGSASDNDPHFLGIDLEAIEKRNAIPRKKGLGLFSRPDLDVSSERVIAQSSRDAIRVMEHKELGIKHEWNCDDQGSARPTGQPRHVIAPGSGNAIHVTEHTALNIKHEWNCDDRENRR